MGGLLAALALGLGVAGFLIATGVELPASRPDDASRGAEASSGVANGTAEAQRYTEIVPSSMGKNAARAASVEPAALGGVTPNELMARYGSAAPTPGERGAALVGRSMRRAYAGAPPVVPHAIDQLGTSACVVCHSNGMKVGDVVAPAMSHGLLASCTQCHVEERGAPPVGGMTATQIRGLLAESGFEGQAEPGEGSRAWQGAPPTIPHSTWMRQACISCHGGESEAGLSSSHPWRASCTQCHAPSATLDQAPIPATPLPAGQ